MMGAKSWVCAALTLSSRADRGSGIRADAPRATWGSNDPSRKLRATEQSEIWLSQRRSRFTPDLVNFRGSDGVSPRSDGLAPLITFEDACGARAGVTCSDRRRALKIVNVTPIYKLSSVSFTSSGRRLRSLYREQLSDC
jgi:hypothetical protein